MSDTDTLPSLDLTHLTAGIVAAYVSHNLLPPAGMAEVIASVHTALRGLIVSMPEVPDSAEFATPAQIDRSITPDALVSFLNGRPYKALKRHLNEHGLDTHSYRKRFGLPNDYPMVAPSYAVQRSALAKQTGLGRHRRTNAADEPI